MLDQTWRWMQPIIKLLVWACFLPSVSQAGQDNAVRVRFQVRLADSAATDEPLFLAGDHTKLGNWRPDGLKLSPTADGLHYVEVELPPGTTIQFKVTRGTWDSVEKGTTGTEIRNRTATVGSVIPNQSQLIAVTVENWSNPQRTTITGTLKTHENFPSQILETRRTVAVWLPPGYETSDERYPVLYLQDGQNLFDQTTAAFGAEWEVDETASRLIEQKKIPPVIIVGIWNTPQRLREYTPTRDANYGEGGSAEDYLRSLVDELKPFVDTHYRTRSDRENTAIGGSSLGGLFAIFAATEAEQVFFGAAAFSPSLFWNQENLLRRIESEPTRFEKIRLYADMGSQEGKSPAAQQANLERIRRLAAALGTASGQRNIGVWIREIEGGEHHEPAWAARFGDGLEFLFGHSQ